MNFNNSAKIEIKDAVHMMFVGDTGTGKSNSVKWMMRDLSKQYDYGIVICGTGFSNEDYDWIPEKYRYEYLPVDIIEALVEDQKKKKMIEKKARAKGNSKPAPKVFIILDDIIGTFDRYDDGKIFNQVTKWRHYNISTIWITQDVKHLAPSVRSSASIIYVTKIKDKNMGSIYSLCAQGFRNQSHFKDFVQTNTVKHQLLMFDMTNPYAEEYIKILKPPKDVPLYQLKY